MSAKGAAWEPDTTTWQIATTGAKSLKRNVDLIPETGDLAPYRLVVAPGLRIVSDKAADRLGHWVQAGGILVLDRNAGTRSPDGSLRPLVEPGVFSVLAGVRVPGTIRERGTPHAVSFHGENGRFTVADSEVVIANGCEVMAQYLGENLEGQPAVTLHPAGRGFVVFVSFTCREDAFFDALFAAIARRFSILPLLAAPNGVDCVSRTDGHSEFIFLLNNTREPAEIELPQPLPELLANAPAAKRLKLAGLQVAILERPAGS